MREAIRSGCFICAPLFIVLPGAIHDTLPVWNLEDHEMDH